MTKKSWVIIGGPIFALAMYLLLLLIGVGPLICTCLAITALTAWWWVTEALPIPATSLVPFVLFPFFGVLTHKQAAAGLGSHLIILLMGGFMIAKGLEKSQLHKQFALIILHKVGSNGGKSLIFAFMLCGAALSMWISNTASCLVLLPIALAVLKQLDRPELNLPVVLGIAFSCNLGGMATLVGTPPNLIFAEIYEQNSGAEFGFTRWMGFGLPIVAIGLPLMALWLARNVRAGERAVLPEVAEWTLAQRRALIIFALVVFLWVFRLGPEGGWTEWLGISHAGDSTIALLGVVLMFLVPTGTKDDKGVPERLLDWQTASDIPWGMLLLFAGGITIANAFQVSGAAQLIGASLSSLTALPPFLLILLLCLSVTFLTEITSNVATTSLLMPIFAAAAVEANLPVELLMMPAAVSASCAFMLPVATAPNAISYGTGLVTIKEMAREGVILNLMMALIITIVCYTLLV